MNKVLEKLRGEFANYESIYSCAPTELFCCPRTFHHVIRVLDQENIYYGQPQGKPVILWGVELKCSTMMDFGEILLRGELGNSSFNINKEMEDFPIVHFGEPMVAIRVVTSKLWTEKEMKIVWLAAMHVEMEVKSIYVICKELVEFMPGRSFDAIRKKIYLERKKIPEDIKEQMRNTTKLLKMMKQYDVAIEDHVPYMGGLRRMKLEENR